MTNPQLVCATHRDVARLERIWRLSAVTNRDTRPQLSELEATLIVGTERFEVTGRCVLMLARLAERAE